MSVTTAGENYKSEMQATFGSIWDVGYPVPQHPKDTINYEYFSYEQLVNLTGTTNYRINTTDVNSYFYLPSAQIQVEFTVYNTGDPTMAPLSTSEATNLASNGWSLFQDAKLRFQDQEVAQVLHPGKMCHVINITEKGLTYLQTCGQNSFYYVDTISDNADLNATGATHVVASYVPAPAAVVSGATTQGGLAYGPQSMIDHVQYVRAQIAGTLGPQSAVIATQYNPYYDNAMDLKVNRSTVTPQKIFLPLKDIFPICSLDRVIRGTKIEIELNLISQFTEALFGAQGASGVSINISRIRLWVARVAPSLEALTRVESQIAANPVVSHVYDNIRLYYYNYTTTGSGEQRISIQTRQNRPSKVYFGFQYSQRDTKVQLNPLEFDLLGSGTPGVNTTWINLSSVYCAHNGRQVPVIQYNPQDDFSRIISDLYVMNSKEIEDSAVITKDSWLKMWPLFGFDLSLLEGAPYESRSLSTLDAVWTPSAVVSNPNLTSSLYNLIVVVVSEGSAIIDYSAGVTTIKTV